jgi:hypothetical protein
MRFSSLERNREDCSGRARVPWCRKSGLRDLRDLGFAGLGAGGNEAGMVELGWITGKRRERSCVLRTWERGIRKSGGWSGFWSGSLRTLEHVLPLENRGV